MKHPALARWALDAFHTTFVKTAHSSAVNQPAPIGVRPIASEVDVRIDSPMLDEIAPKDATTAHCTQSYNHAMGVNSVNDKLREIALSYWEYPHSQGTVLRKLYIPSSPAMLHALHVKNPFDDNA